MNKTSTAILTLLIVISIFANIASAITVSTLSVDELSPGGEGVIRLEIENNFNEKIENVVLTLEFKDVPFNSVGSSSDSTNEIDEDDEKTFSFRIKSNNDIDAGNYQIPYTFSYQLDNETFTRSGSIGVTVRAQPELAFSASVETPVIGKQTTITLKVVNKGLADAQFVNVKVFSSGFTLLSEDEVYIGTIDSDDFETASFDVIFTSKNPTLSALIEYRDFDNERLSESVNLPIDIYSREQAIQLGLISRNNTYLYIGIVIAIVIAWFIWRAVRKRQRMKRSMKMHEK